MQLLCCWKLNQENKPKNMTSLAKIENKLDMLLVTEKWVQLCRTKFKWSASTDWCSFFVQTMEPVDQLLQCVDPARDRELWVRENKTGEIRPVDIEIWPQRCLTIVMPRLTLRRIDPEAESLRTDWNLRWELHPTDLAVTPSKLRDVPLASC